MIGRPLSFLAGVGMGAYAVIKSRRAAEALTVEGLTDRVRAAKLGAALFADEARAAAASKQTELRERHHLALGGGDNPGADRDLAMLSRREEEEDHDGQR